MNVRFSYCLRAAFLFLSSAAMLSATPMTLDVGPPVGSFSGRVRGYMFTAPTDFWIQAMYVPTDASSAPQTVELLRFNSGVPPSFPGTTNNFTSLFRAVGVAGTSQILANVFVQAGDVIGVLGWRGVTNSYAANGPYVSSILGQPVTLTRIGMQFNLNNGPAHDIWQEAAFPIGRVELIYDSVSAVPEPATISLLGIGALLLYPAHKRLRRKRRRRS